MSIENQITLDVYEKLANVYLNNTIKHNMLDLEKAKLEIEELKKFLKNSFSSLPKNSKILEIGSANGEKSKYLQELGYKVTPSDIATDFLKAIKLNGLEPIKFNVLEDNFLDKYYGILCWKVFVHFTKEDALKALFKTYDALEKKGIFVFNAMNRENKNVESEWLDFAYEYRMGIERYFNYYYQEELDKLISQSKYEIIDFHKEGGDDNKKWLVYVLRK